MDTALFFNIALIVLGAALGGGFFYFKALRQHAFLKERMFAEEQKNMYLQERLDALKGLQEKEGQIQAELMQAQKRVAELETAVQLEQKNFQEKIALLEQSEARLKETFQNLSSEALSKNSANFIDIAKLTFEKMQQGAQKDLESRQQSITDFMKPMQESLSKIDGTLQEVEKTRVGAYEGLKSQIHHLMTAQKELKSETVNLVHALKTPQVRGRWGEMQLRRVVEMAGMVAHCDFMEQVSTDSEEEKEGKLRPDMIVNLPGGQHVIIDAKAPMSAYLKAMETDELDQKKAFYQDHARLIRQHIKQLSARSYWSQFSPSPEFVVLFLPGEQFFSAALQEDPGLIELGAENKVILSTPTTLIALLRAVSYGWRQEKLAENAREISKLGQMLYDRLADLTQHLSKVGRHLGQAVGAYNQTVGSFEQRVMVSARRFESLGIDAKKSTDPIAPVDVKERDLIENDSPVSKET